MTDKTKTSRESTPASDGKSAARPVQALALVETKNSDRSSMWKALQQLKAVLPYLSKLLPLLDARVLPLLEIVGLGHAQQNAGLSLSKELREDVTGLQGGQHDIRLALQDQALEIKRLEDEIALLRQASEKNAAAHATLVEDVRSIGAWVRGIGAGLAVLLVVLIAMAGALLLRVAR
jgi:hypothetical protein